MKEIEIHNRYIFIDILGREHMSKYAIAERGVPLLVFDSGEKVRPFLRLPGIFSDEQQPVMQKQWRTEYDFAFDEVLLEGELRQVDTSRATVNFDHTKFGLMSVVDDRLCISWLDAAENRSFHSLKELESRVASEVGKARQKWISRLEFFHRHRETALTRLKKELEVHRSAACSYKEQLEATRRELTDANRALREIRKLSVRHEGQPA